MKEKLLAGIVLVLLIALVVRSPVAAAGMVHGAWHVLTRIGDFIVLLTQPG